MPPVLGGSRHVTVDTTRLLDLSSLRSISFPYGKADPRHGTADTTGIPHYPGREEESVVERRCHAYRGSLNR